MTGHIEKMNQLKARGFNPRIILDIGAHEGLWAKEAKHVFPGSEVVMFEANPVHEQTLKNMGMKYYIDVLSDEDEKTVEFFCIKNSPYNTGDSVFLENTRHYTQDNRTTKIVKTKTLDSILKKNNIKPAHVDFIKLDVQGSEQLILEGATTVLPTVECVLMEVQFLEYNIGAPKFYDMISFMDKHGYQIFDIFGLYYLPECKLLNQADVLFVKKNSHLIPKSDLR